MHKRNFLEEFKERERSFKMMDRFIKTFIGLVFVCVLAVWLTVGILVYRAAGSIEDKGLKTMIEEIWCGKENPNCIGK